MTSKKYIQDLAGRREVMQGARNKKKLEKQGDGDEKSEFFKESK